MTTVEKVLLDLEYLTKEQEEELTFLALDDVINTFDDIVNDIFFAYSEAGTPLVKDLDLYLDKMFSVLRQSNFDLAIGEFLLDLSVGTAAMLIQPGDDLNPVTFTPVPQYLIALEEGPSGTVDNVYRKFKVRGEAIKRQFPDATLPQSLELKI